LSFGQVSHLALSNHLLLGIGGLEFDRQIMVVLNVTHCLMKSFRNSFNILKNKFVQTQWLFIESDS